jgi:predicted MFS family arabinose efflux permease
VTAPGSAAPASSAVAIAVQPQKPSETLSQHAPPDARERRRRWYVLGTTCVPLFALMVDNTATNTALTSIQADLNMSISALEWVVSGYTLSFAVFLLAAGKISDTYGRRMVFVAGLAIFTLSSLVCGLSTSGAMLIAARAVQGLGSATSARRRRQPQKPARHEY